ncbi:MAG: tripartite tricarboxylate transporter substrate binding protein [Burkholderiales bacterium]
MKRFWILLGTILSCHAGAQGYPSKPVKLVVPFPAGSATDQIARVIGQELQGALGQPFVVDNKPGAQGTIAAEGVAKSAPDGYTLMVSTNTPQAAAPALFKQLRYDPVKDFAPVARLGTISFMLMVPADFPAKSFKEFLAYAKANPGKLSGGYGSAGSQVSQAMMRSMGKVDFVDVPFKGLPEAITNVMGGSISFTFADLANALAQQKGGKLKGLAVTSERRSPLAPEVPAIAEELKGYELIAWFALMAPAGTPKEIVQVLFDATSKSLRKNEIKEKFALLGTDVAPMDPVQLEAFIKSEIAKWGKMAKEAGIQPQ